MPFPKPQTTEEMERLATALQEPFDPDEVDFRGQGKVSSTGKTEVLAYVDARTVANRLDDVVGVGNWSFHWDAVIVDKGQVQLAKGRLTLYGDIVSEDAGDASTFSPSLGAVSHAFKRCAAQRGVGRYLYDLPKVWKPCDSGGRVEKAVLDAMRNSLPRPKPENLKYHPRVDFRSPEDLIGPDGSNNDDPPGGGAPVPQQPARPTPPAPQSRLAPAAPQVAPPVRPAPKAAATSGDPRTALLSANPELRGRVADAANRDMRFFNWVIDHKFGPLAERKHEFFSRATQLQGQQYLEEYDAWYAEYRDAVTAVPPAPEKEAPQRQATPTPVAHTSPVDQRPAPVRAAPAVQTPAAAPAEPAVAEIPEDGSGRPLAAGDKLTRENDPTSISLYELEAIKEKAAAKYGPLPDQPHKAMIYTILGAVHAWDAKVPGRRMADTWTYEDYVTAIGYLEAYDLSQSPEANWKRLTGELDDFDREDAPAPAATASSVTGSKPVAKNAPTRPREKVPA